jgi:hypothetical protein
MNHKRRRSKNARAGCLLCKPHKANGAKDREPIAVRRALQDDGGRNDESRRLIDRELDAEP